MASDTLAEAKRDPSQAQYPVTYDNGLAYLLGANSIVQKCCPAAFGIALASSDNEHPIQILTSATRGIPYTKRAGPPESIPVMKAPEIPNHEFVRENPSPNIDHRENLRRI